jgi:hypothetical protein
VTEEAVRQSLTVAAIGPRLPTCAAPANADGLEETDITSADVPDERPPQPLLTRSCPAV